MTSDSMRDNPNLIAVPVIVSFNTRGEVLPLYFKFKQETVKILSCTQIDQSIGSLRYKCQYEFNEAARYVELYYNEHIRTWFIDTKNIHTKKGIHSDSFFHGIIMRMYNFLKM